MAKRNRIAIEGLVLNAVHILPCFKQQQILRKFRVHCLSICWIFRFI